MHSSQRDSTSTYVPFAHGAVASGGRGFKVGGLTIPGGLALAPMAGITDVPFRTLCRQFGAAYTVAEMISAQPHLRHSKKSRYRSQVAAAESPRVVQIVGSDAAELAAAARYNQEQGADIIDINMGCPAKKVCRRAAGAALLADEENVERILQAVTRTVSIPVTLKYRTGIDPDHKNAVRIARIAEAAGVALLTLHGRTRECAFNGQAEYETIRAVKQTVAIPVLANGDIDSVDKALYVLRETGADGLMIGRAALGRPWLFREIEAALNGQPVAPLTSEERQQWVLKHLNAIAAFYDEPTVIRLARKHLLAYARTTGDDKKLRERIINATDFAAQCKIVSELYSGMGQGDGEHALLH